MDRKRVVIMGAAGRDFHDFNVMYRNDPDVEVVAFTATQTDVPAVHHAWGAPDRMPIRRLTLAGVAAGVEDGTFAAGSMGPKVSAAAEFVRRTGRFAAIGALEDAFGVFQGRGGTQVVNETLVTV